MSSKLFLLPLVPALAFSIVGVASRISLPTSTTTARPVVIVQHVAPVPAPALAIEDSAPVKRIIIDPPAPPPEPECRGCVIAT